MVDPKKLLSNRNLVGSGVIGVGAFEVANRLSWLSRHVEGDVFTQWTTAIVNAPLAFGTMVPSLNQTDLAIGVVAGCGTALAVNAKLNGKRKFRQGKEYGSARWSTAADVSGFTDKGAFDNLILSGTEALAFDDSGLPHENKRNKNVIVVGSSGSGKTRYYVLPNLMQASRKASYVVTDPKGQVAKEVGTLLTRRGFDVRILNLVDMGRSLHYNPMHYVSSDKDVLKLVNALIANTKGEGEHAGEDFWVKAERLYLCALIAYICEFAPEDERNFSTLLELVNQSEAREDDEDFNSPTDELFEHVKATDPDCFAVRQYAKYKQAAGHINCRRLLNTDRLKALM